MNSLNLAYIHWVDYDNVIVLQVRMKLQHCLQQWTDYNSNMAQCKKWMQSVEKTVKNLDLKSSVSEKQQQLQLVEVDFLELPCIII